MRTKPIFKLTSMGVMIAFTVFGLVACNNGKDSKADEAVGMAANNPVINKDSASMASASPATAKIPAKKKGRATANVVYSNTDVAPQFPGGPKALDNYINDHLEYPQRAIDNNTGGTVRVSFVVDERGKVSHAKILGNKVGDGLDEQALKVVNNMPEWTPGKVHGRNVKTRLELPIAFQVES